VFADACALAVERLADSGGQPSVWEAGQSRIGGHTAHELVDGRQAAERGGAVSAH
jgi:hypothetical protein